MINLIVFIIITLILIFLILFITYFINSSTNDYEKHSAYECGFEPFGDARSFFDIHFYTIGLLFIIFDLEVVFLIPVIVDIASISFLGYISLLIFLLIVLIGFYYEWAIGLLDWVPNKISYNFSYLVILLENSLLGYVQTEFLIFVFLITISLLFSQSSHLVYRVINLAILSLLIISLWAYYTDIIFLYIVYILAFIGAVVMLFLSVILMLPASLIKTNDAVKQNYYLFLLVITEVNSIEQDIYRYIHLFFIFSILLFINWRIFRVFKILGVSIDDIFVLLSKENIDYIKIKILSIQNITDVYNIVKNSVNYCKSILKNIFGIGVSSDVYGGYANKILNNKPVPVFAPIGMFMHDLLFFFYIHIEINLYGTISRYMYDDLKPVWGNLFKVLEYGHAPARDEKFSTWPIPDIRRRYIPMQLNYSIFKIFPEITIIPLISYIKDNSLISNIINKIIFLINALNFLFINAILNIFFWFIKNIEIQLVLQFIFIFFLYFLVTPFSCNVPIDLYNNNLVILEQSNLSSLFAIKTILYEQNILYLLAPVIGLLIALIGSAVFTRSSKK